MLKTITTVHPEIGYAKNLAVVEDALRTHFGFSDNSHVATAVAAHVWAQICPGGQEKRWGIAEVKQALDGIRARLADIEMELGKIAPEVAPLRLFGILRQHTCGNTPCGVDVALLEQGSDDDAEPVAVMGGHRASELASRLLTAVNGRIPRLLGADGTEAVLLSRAASSEAGA